METLNNTNPHTLAFAMVVIGIIIRYVISQRKFNRRGLGGLQHFNSYAEALIVSFLEWVFKWSANALILWGIIKLLFS